MLHEQLKEFATINSNSKIKVKENNKQIIILNELREEFYVIKIDGGLLKNKLASDYAVTKEQLGDLIIELKGNDADHALDQIVATAKYWQDNGLKNKALAAVIVSNKKPSSDTKTQKYQQLMARKFGAPLHIITKNDEFLFDRIMSFDGPK